MTEPAAKPPILWTKVRGPITANARMVELANAIDDLLVTPIAVLPKTTADIVRPFEIGISPAIQARLKPEASLTDLKAAIRNYARNRVYVLACAQPGAMRHDVDGQAVEPVSDTDRMSAMITFKQMQAKIDKRRKELEEKQAAA